MGGAGLVSVTVGEHKLRATGCAKTGGYSQAVGGVQISRRDRARVAPGNRDGSSTGVGGDGTALAHGFSSPLCLCLSLSLSQIPHGTYSPQRRCKYTLQPLAVPVSLLLPLFSTTRSSRALLNSKVSVPRTVRCTEVPGQGTNVQKNTALSHTGTVGNAFMAA